MTIELPRKKVDIVLTCRISKNRENFKIRKFAALVSTLILCCPAIKYSYGHTNVFERHKYQALKINNGNYEGSMIISNEVRRGFHYGTEPFYQQKIPLHHYNFVCMSFLMPSCQDGEYSVEIGKVILSGTNISGANILTF